MIYNGIIKETEHLFNISRKNGISKYGPSQIGDFKGDILSEACGF